MTDFLTPKQIDLFLYGVCYLLQAVGMAAVAVCVYLRPDTFLHKHFFSAVMLLEAAVISITLLSGSSFIIAIFMSVVMNLLHGAVAACYLIKLASSVPQQYRARAFGFGYAVGSVASWLLSLPDGGNFLDSRGIAYVYLVLIALTMLLNWRSEDIRYEKQGFGRGGDFNPRLLILAFGVLVLLSLVKNVGFYFPTADISEKIDLEFSRAFYALGLIAAGIINDKSRKSGAVCCLASLVFPFISIVLPGADYAMALWILGYIFLGFYAVYRVVLFSDISASKPSLLPLAVCGLMAGRVGDSLGCLAGIYLGGSIIPLLSVTGGLFILVIFLFFTLYHRLYIPVLRTGGSGEDRYRSFEKEYGLTRRESEVFRLVVQNLSNSEISGRLFVSESTVKFHIGNILKKTDCSNRSELIMQFEK
jgi:DNA-binding CsgD family transcriptional regulator